MPPRKKAKRKKAPCQDPSSLPVSMLSLPPEILIRIFSLSGPGPARLARTCKAWRALLAEPNPDLYSQVKLFCPTSGQKLDPGNAGYAVGPSGGHLPRWLKQRRSAIQKLALHNFSDHGIFFSVALGLMASAPLQELVFSSCKIQAEQVLPSLQLMPACLTRLELGSLVESTCAYLEGALKALPQLEALKLVYASSGHSYSRSYWPALGIMACTRLRSLHVEDVGQSMGLTQVPTSLSSLARLETFKYLGCKLGGAEPVQPAVVAALRALTALSLLVPPGAEASNLLLPTNMSCLSSLKSMALSTREVPVQIAAVGTSLTSLHFQQLQWCRTVEQQLQPLHTLTNIASLRFQDLTGMTRVTAGLFEMINSLPFLRDLAVVNCGVEEASFGTCISRIQKLDLSGNRFTTLPNAFHRAIACRSLKITFKALAQVFTSADIAQCSLLRMRRLTTLSIQQPHWAAADVEALLLLQKAFDQRFGGRAPRIQCPASKPSLPVTPHAPVAPAVFVEDFSEDDYDSDGYPYDDEGYDHDGNFVGDDYW